MITILERKALIRSALKLEPLDLIVNNVRILNPLTGRILPGALGIKHGMIVHCKAEGFDSRQVIDAEGRIALPGFIDTHIHLDSTLLTPEVLAELIVPCGTTSVFVDPMEISNVAGIEGLKALLISAATNPYRIFIEVSSRVPTAPGLETTGGTLGLPEVKEVLSWPASISLGELDSSKILGMHDEYLLKIEAAHALGKIANGHAAGLTAENLVAYACGGLSDDHECVDFDDALLRLDNGLAVLVREGSTERNLEPILRGALKANLDYRHFMFCTDDKHPDDILNEGHVDFMVRKAISLGVDPVQAVLMASYNAAVHFRLDHILGSLSPGKAADFLLVSNLNDMRVEDVFMNGRHVAQNGKLVEACPPVEYPEWLFDTVHLIRGKEADDFVLASDGESREVWVIELESDQIINGIGRAVLKVDREKGVQADIEQGISKLAVVERYGKNGGIGIAFVRGFGLKKGALASSVSHDHHNISVVGCNDEDMAVCVRSIEEMNGGLVISSGGEVLAALPLPLGGLMTQKPALEVIKKLDEMKEIYNELGGNLPAPFMTLSFISLPTVPELGLTDKGLVHVRQHKLMSTFTDQA
jgi:adenine deaminase